MTEQARARARTRIREINVTTINNRAWRYVFRVARNKRLLSARIKCTIFLIKLLIFGNIEDASMRNTIDNIGRIWYLISGLMMAHTKIAWIQIQCLTFHRFLHNLRVILLYVNIHDIYFEIETCAYDYKTFHFVFIKPNRLKQLKSEGEEKREREIPQRELYLFLLSFCFPFLSLYNSHSVSKLNVKRRSCNVFILIPRALLKLYCSTFAVRKVASNKFETYPNATKRLI